MKTISCVFAIGLFSEGWADPELTTDTENAEENQHTFVKAIFLSPLWKRGVGGDFKIKCFPAALCLKYLLGE